MITRCMCPKGLITLVLFIVLFTRCTAAHNCTELSWRDHKDSWEMFETDKKTAVVDVLGGRLTPFKCKEAQKSKCPAALLRLDTSSADAVDDRQWRTCACAIQITVSNETLLADNNMIRVQHMAPNLHINQQDTVSTIKHLYNQVSTFANSGWVCSQVFKEPPYETCTPAMTVPVQNITQYPLPYLMLICVCRGEACQFKEITEPSKARQLIPAVKRMFPSPAYQLIEQTCYHDPSHQSGYLFDCAPITANRSLLPAALLQTLIEENTYNKQHAVFDDRCCYKSNCSESAKCTSTTSTTTTTTTTKTHSVRVPVSTSSSTSPKPIQTSSKMGQSADQAQHEHGSDSKQMIAGWVAIGLAVFVLLVAMNLVAFYFMYWRRRHKKGHHEDSSFSDSRRHKSSGASSDSDSTATESDRYSKHHSSNTSDTPTDQARRRLHRLMYDSPHKRPNVAKEHNRFDNSTARSESSSVKNERKAAAQSDAAIDKTQPDLKATQQAKTPAADKTQLDDIPVNEKMDAKATQNDSDPTKK